jgi:hypothetical protein
MLIFDLVRAIAGANLPFVLQSELQNIDQNQLLSILTLLKFLTLGNKY